MQMQDHTVGLSRNLYMDHILMQIIKKVTAGNPASINN